MTTPRQGDVWQASLNALPPSFKRKACHFYPDIPTFRIGTCNHGGGGLGALNTMERQYSMTRGNLEALMVKCDIIFSQETKFQTESYLKSYVGWRAFPTQAQRKPYEEGDEVKEQFKAGGIIWVRKTVLKNFEDPEHVIIKEGYVHYIVLKPKPMVDVRFPVFTKSCALMNVYLHSDPKYWKDKVELLRLMRDHRYPTEYMYAAGDTNIKEHKEDSNGGSISRVEVRRVFNEFLTRHGLTEIHQPLPTRVDRRSWSRIDRFFMKVPKNLEMEDFMDMTVSLPKHPHEPGRGTEHPSDHYQVLLTPSPATLGKGARFAIPVWLVKKHSVGFCPPSERTVETGGG